MILSRLRLNLSQTFKQSMQSIHSMKHIIIADPAVLRNQEEYENTINEGTCASPGSFIPGLYVRVPVTSSFIDSLKERKSKLMFSKVNDESFWYIGSNALKSAEQPDIDMTEYDYLGSHISDSGLTAIVEENPFEDASVAPIDWTEFVLSTLDQSTESPSEELLEEYGLYRFFSKIPDESTEAAVYGKLAEGGQEKCFESILIRSLDAVTPEGNDFGGGDSSD